MKYYIKRASNFPLESKLFVLEPISLDNNDYIIELNDLTDINKLIKETNKSIIFDKGNVLIVYDDYRE